jgi:hypothetical protein
MGARATRNRGGGEHWSGAEVGRSAGAGAPTRTTEESAAKLLEARTMLGRSMSPGPNQRGEAQINPGSRSPTTKIGLYRT